MLATAILAGAPTLPLDLAAADPLGGRDWTRPGPSPDADLIALCEAHPALIGATNEDDGDLDDSNPVWAAYYASRDAISAAKPQTLDGMRAKALVAKLEARAPDGSDMHEGTAAGILAWELLNDLLLLTGGEA